MRLFGLIGYGVLFVVVGGLLLSGVSMAKSGGSNKAKYSDLILELRTLPDVMAEITAPDIKDPEWLKEQKEKATAAALASNEPGPAAPVGDRRENGIKRTFSYSVESWGRVTVGVDDFRAKARATLSDPRGWSRAGALFTEVPSGGDFILVISEAAELDRRYSPGCSSLYSCRVGKYVIINQDRWAGATPAWNEGGGGLRDYQHMVVNHEWGTGSAMDTHLVVVPAKKHLLCYSSQ